jgi:hypothetical protein
MRERQRGGRAKREGRGNKRKAEEAEEQEEGRGVQRGMHWKAEEGGGSKGNFFVLLIFVRMYIIVP